MKKICFVCSANECRSPMAEKIFQSMLKKESVKNIKVSSAGIGAIEGTKMSNMAKKALKNLGYKTGNKKSKQLKEIASNVVYVAMSKQEKDYLNKKNVFTFGELIGGKDVVDPYGENQETYDKTAKQIEDYCKILLEKVKKI